MGINRVTTRVRIRIWARVRIRIWIWIGLGSGSGPAAARSVHQSVIAIALPLTLAQALALTLTAEHMSLTTHEPPSTPERILRGSASGSVSGPVRRGRQAAAWALLVQAWMNRGNRHMCMTRPRTEGCTLVFLVAGPCDTPS